MWLEYFKKRPDVEFPDRKVLYIGGKHKIEFEVDILNVDWATVFKLLGDPTIISINIYVNWGDMQAESVAYLIKEYAKYRNIPCEAILRREWDLFATDYS